ncbi:MAG: FHA domain-containing protein [Oscillochloridaceae bacterium]|nr:FHA domain-containing protein [Chloroflexaceae bacterium]MDW8390245.1 FHA domain-containing protein [Oscillochloridaceae bacterium]
MFDIANLSIGVLLLLLRVAVVFLLYFFLWQVLRVVARDLRGASPAPLPASQYGQLVVVSAGQTGIPVGKSFPLAPITIIGRSTEADISLNDTFLSAEHARLEWHDGVWQLEDLHSTNGTYLNGFEVRSRTEAHDGDIIRVGRVELKLLTA